MQKNQTINKNSIVQNKALREKVALDLAHAMNAMIKEGVENGKYPKEYSEKLFSDDEIKKWANNQKVVDKYVNTSKHTDIISKMRNKFDKLPDKDPLYTDSLNSKRNAYLNMDLSDTVEADEKNQQTFNDVRNKNTAAEFSYKMIDKLDNVDPARLYPTTEEEAIELSDEELVAGTFGFGIVDEDSALNHNKKLQETIHANAFLYQGTDTNKVLNEKYRNFLCMLIPPRDSMMIVDLISINAPEFEKALKSYSNVEEIDYHKISEYATAVGVTSMNFEDNKKTKEFFKTYNIKQGNLLTFNIVDKDGNVVKFDEGLNHFKDGKLQDGYKKIDWTEKEIEEHNLKKQGAIDNAKATRFELLNQRLSEKCDPIDERLKAPLAEFASKYEKFTKENENVKDDLEKYTNISKFMEENKELVNSIDRLKKDIINEKQNVLDTEKLIKPTFEAHKSNMKLNYNNLNRVVNEKTSKLFVADATKTYPGMEKIANTKFAKNDIVKDAINDLKPYMSKKDCIESIALVHDMNAKDKEYNNRGFFGKLWYRNSHNQMMQTRDKLINDLASRGIDRSNLEKIGKEDTKEKINLEEFAKTSMANVEKIQNERVENVNKCYERFIEKPKKEIKALEEKLKGLEKDKVNAREDFTKIRDGLFDKFKEDNKDLFKDNPNMTGKDLEHSGNDKVKMEIHNQFRSWREDKANKETLEEYKKAYSKYKDISAAYKSLGEEIKDRNYYINEGMEYNKQESVIDNTDVDTKKIQEKLVNQLSKEKGEINIVNEKDAPAKEKELDSVTNNK